ncbi:TVP38/TMEM64 family protein [Litorimonas sp. WD9-15]|uniref:TVP38/TMEM64 family protein n=1 Tax=Litorimonas sp. WD9-15 TaxID=3418716 RepID=UPI003D08913E
MNVKTALWLAASIVVPILLLLFAETLFGVTQADITAWMTSLDNSPWAIPITIFLFCALAFVGAPQWMLVTAAVIAFGPIEGGVVSWVASLTSASLGFYIGRLAGAERLSRIDAKLIRKLSHAVRRNGFMTSLVVRLVPTGPAILVNLAAGVSRMNYIHFLSGTAIGIIPKIIVVALISQGVISGLSGSLMAIGFAALALVAIGLSWVARKRLEARSPL